MRRFLAIGSAWVLLASSPAAAQQFYQTPITPVDASATVSTSVVTLAPAASSSNARSYMRLEILTPNGEIFCTFDGTTPGVGTIGSHPYVGEGAGEEDALSRGDLVPQGPIKCVAAASTTVTLKVYPQ